jgi:hypothetical protein
MPVGTLDILKLEGNPTSYQIMFEENAGGTFVARVEPDELVDFMHQEMRIDLPKTLDAARKVEAEGRTRVPDVFLEENNLHAIMDYREVEDLGEE